MAKKMPVLMYALTVSYPRNRCDQIALERLNRYILRLSTRDFESPYSALLETTNCLPVFKRVLYGRISLCQRYSKGGRHLPEGVLVRSTHDTRFRRRFRNFALDVSQPTGIRYGYSSLELSTHAWNRVPENLVLGNIPNVSKRLSKAQYGDTSWVDFVAMEAAIRLL